MGQDNQHAENIENWLRLIRAEGVGPVTFTKLLNHFGSVDAVLGTSAGQLSKVESIGIKTAERIAATRDNFDVSSELDLADRLGVRLITLEDSRYPPVLRRIYDPPPVLYFKGTLRRADNLAVAIVGSRRCSLYGSEQAGRFAHLLASCGFTIVSGMARGIDTAAHQGALSAGGRNIAVQGCGLANIFPPENKKLFEMITESGCCVSELPLKYEPLSQNFPSRNRIIAGLSMATIVIEAAARSGALITARLAMENNREVMAVPGKIDSPLSKGTNRLIKDGAVLVDCVEDVTEAIGSIGRQLTRHLSETAAEKIKSLDCPLFDISQLRLSNNEQLVYNCLGREPLHIEQLIAQMDSPAGIINASLVSLQLKGLVKQLPGSMFVKKAGIKGGSE